MNTVQFDSKADLVPQYSMPILQPLRTLQVMASQSSHTTLVTISCIQNRSIDSEMYKKHFVLAVQSRRIGSRYLMTLLLTPELLRANML